MLSAPNAAFREESPCCFGGLVLTVTGSSQALHTVPCARVCIAVWHTCEGLSDFTSWRSPCSVATQSGASPPGRHDPSAGTATEATSHPGQCHEVLRTVAAHPYLQGRQRPFNSGMETGLWDRRVLGGWGRWLSRTGDVASGLHEGTKVTAKGGVCPREAT